MKLTTLALLGGLCCAGTALAADPAPQQEPAVTGGTSMKIGIDAKTGKRRALTAAESAVLDAQQPAPAQARMGRMAAPARKSRIPATAAEAARTAVVVNGITMMKPSQDMLSMVTVVRDEQGNLVFSEDGVPMGKAQEAAHE